MDLILWNVWQASLETYAGHLLELMHIHFTMRNCTWTEMFDLDWWLSDVLLFCSFSIFKVCFKLVNISNSGCFHYNFLNMDYTMFVFSYLALQFSFCTQLRWSINIDLVVTWILMYPLCVLFDILFMDFKQNRQSAILNNEDTFVIYWLRYLLKWHTLCFWVILERNFSWPYC